MYQSIDDLPREKLVELLGNFAKNWLALDGLWFQSVEKRRGMDEAIEHDTNAWRVFSAIEARRIKELLGLPERAGVEGLARALHFRMYAPLNKFSVEVEADTVTYRMITCRVQEARRRKGMPYHPCKSVGLAEYESFAGEIDDRFRMECVSCHPDVTDTDCACVWRFTLVD